MRSSGRGSPPLPRTSQVAEFSSLLYNRIDGAEKMAELKLSDYRYARNSSSVRKLPENTEEKVLLTPQMLQDLFISKENIYGDLKNTPLVNGSLDLARESKTSNSRKNSILTFGIPSFRPKSKARILE